MVDGKAEGVPHLCTSCGECADVCPVGAIVITEVLRPAAITIPEPRSSPVPAQAQVIPSRATEPWTRRMLDFVSRWLIPSLADGLITALDRRLSNRTSPTYTSAPIGRPRAGTETRQGHRQRRRRRGK
jgi:ferredoxin